MGKVSAQRKLFNYGSLLFKAMVFMYYTVNLSLCSEEEIPELVTRRQNDIITFRSALHHYTCNNIMDHDNNTYLVDERQCVSDQDLLNGMYSVMFIYLSVSAI